VLLVDINMRSGIGNRVCGLSLLLSFCLSFSIPSLSASEGVPSGQAASLSWQSKARLRHRLTSTPGDLVLDGQGVEFRPPKGSTVRWSFVEIRTIDLVSPGHLSLTSYSNRHWHWPGDKVFHFELATPMPPTVAAVLVAKVEKPAVNGDPVPRAPSFASIPARHRTRAGGTNGVLDFREDCIDYVVTGGKGGRSWRWDDIQTIANPDPYHFRLGGYLETFDFELKQPMSGDLFDRLWDRVYARDLNLAGVPAGEHHANQ
jgi:hypothetical protein